jgi:hypothetical protein
MLRILTERRGTHRNTSQYCIRERTIIASPARKRDRQPTQDRLTRSAGMSDMTLYLRRSSTWAYRDECERVWVVRMGECLLATNRSERSVSSSFFEDHAQPTLTRHPPTCFLSFLGHVSSVREPGTWSGSTVAPRLSGEPDGR